MTPLVPKDNKSDIDSASNNNLIKKRSYYMARAENDYNTSSY